MKYTRLTSHVIQRVKTSLLVPDKEAITVEEVRPRHVYPIERTAAFFLHSFAGAATGPLRLLPLAARRQNGAAQHPHLEVTVSPDQRLHHADQEVLDAGLCVLPGAVADDVGEGGLAVGHVGAVGQEDVCAFS